MPQPPGFLGQVNGIVRFFEDPCSATWTVYVETALPAAGRAILTLLDFGLGDVVRGALRPKGLRIAPHGRRRKPGGRGFRGLPEIGNLLGSMIPGAKEAQGRKITAGARNLWLLDGVTQRILWWWLVVDVGVTFAYEWTSAIQKSEQCSAQAKGYSHWESAPGATWFSPANVWTSPVTNVHVSSRGGATAQNGGCWNGGKPFVGIVTFAGNLIAPSQGSFELRVDAGTPGQQNFQPQLDPNSNRQENVGQSDGTGNPMIYQYRTNGGVFSGQVTSICMGL